ncbi:hypothetical protein JHK82_050291 [Glycine max]|nr:hypothetical protein JHK82_050291 [Glycine max]KAG5094604.1 hypothetical protein JHK84_050192 [Glycine max]
MHLIPEMLHLMSHSFEFVTNPRDLKLFLIVVAAVVPTKYVVPMCGSIPKVSFKVEWKRRLVLASLQRTMAHSHAATTQELLWICRELQGRYEEVEVSLLVAHQWTWPLIRGVCLRATTEISVLSLEPLAE